MFRRLELLKRKKIRRVIVQSDMSDFPEKRRKRKVLGRNETKLRIKTGLLGRVFILFVLLLYILLKNCVDNTVKIMYYTKCYKM